MIVMGQGSSPARARPGARVFCRARGPSLVEGLKPGPGPGPWLKAQGLKGLLKYDFFRKDVELERIAKKTCFYLLASLACAKKI